MIFAPLFSKNFKQNHIKMEIKIMEDNMRKGCDHDLCR